MHRSCQLDFFWCIHLFKSPRCMLIWTCMVNMSHVMRKQAFCICENKGADQLRSNCLCFHYTDSMIPLLSKYKISSLFCACTGLFMSDLFRNHIAEFLMTQLIWQKCSIQFTEPFTFLLLFLLFLLSLLSSLFLCLPSLFSLTLLLPSLCYLSCTLFCGIDILVIRFSSFRLLLLFTSFCSLF